MYPVQSFLETSIGIKSAVSEMRSDRPFTRDVLQYESKRYQKNDFAMISSRLCQTVGHCLAVVLLSMMVFLLPLPSNLEAIAASSEAYEKLWNRFLFATDKDEKCLLGQSLLDKFTLNHRPGVEENVTMETKSLGCAFQRDLLKEGSAKEISFQELALELSFLGGTKIKVTAVVSCIIEITRCAIYPIEDGVARRPISLNLQFLDSSVRKQLFLQCHPRRGGCAVTVIGTVAKFGIYGDVEVSEIVFS